MPLPHLPVVAIFLLTLGAASAFGNVSPQAIDPATETQIRALYRGLIDAENAHDIATVRGLVWDSPSALFVAKTRTAAEGSWAGFWGKQVVIQHISDLFAGAFRIDPDYSREKVAFLAPTVAETYVPVNISVVYAGQSGTPKPFLMILEWVMTPSGAWKMATDIALPIPNTHP